MNEIFTERMRLVRVTSQMRDAMQNSLSGFAKLIALRLPDGWPQFPEAFHTSETGPVPPWTGYLFVDRHLPLLMGNGGFYGPPASGRVEIGYEVAPAFRNRGIATECTEALVKLAFANGVQVVQAHSLAEENASNAVLRKIGMKFCGEELQGDIRAWRWERSK